MSSSKVQHHQQNQYHHHKIPTIFRAFCLLLFALSLAHYQFGGLVPEAEAFIFWKAHSTACEAEICDEIDTNSGRNVACCFLFSKCCGYVILIILVKTAFNINYFILCKTYFNFVFNYFYSYKSLDDAEAIRANLTGTTPSPSK